MTTTTTPSPLSLKDALDATYRARWSKARDGGSCLYSQALKAAESVGGHAAIARCGYNDGAWQALAATLPEITLDVVAKATADWYALGLSPATITKRLNCLGAMGIDVGGNRPTIKPALKWWLRPEEERRVLDYLSEHAPSRHLYRQVGLFIAWTTRTGLRIEESLRLTTMDFTGLLGPTDAMSFNVPGLKSHAAGNITLPLSNEAGEIAQALFWLDDDHVRIGPMFEVTYSQLETVWGDLRSKCLMAADEPTCTLKALRRSAARHLHITKGMPLDMVRQYLRHEDIETTMGYLRLTGGYGTEEMRRWL